MLRILLKQIIHIWKSLELRHKLEALFLLIIIYAFIATRLTGLFEKWLNDSASPSGLTILSAQFFILSVTLTTVFIFRYLLHKQLLLKVLLGKPLLKWEVLKSILFISFKYNSAYLLLILPLANALLLTAGVFWSLFFLIGLILNLLFQSILILLLFIKTESKTFFVFLAVFVILLYNTLFGFLYWQTDFVLVYFILTTVVGLLLSWFLFSKIKQINLEERIKPYKAEHRVKGKITYQGRISLKLPSGILSQLVLKEFHGLWRNNAYRRLKYISVFIYLVLLLLIISGGFEEKTVWLAAMTFLFMWHHYSNTFNDRSKVYCRDTFCYFTAWIFYDQPVIVVRAV